MLQKDIKQQDGVTDVKMTIAAKICVWQLVRDIASSDNLFMGNLSL